MLKVQGLDSDQPGFESQLYYLLAFLPGCEVYPLWASVLSSLK